VRDWRLGSGASMSETWMNVLAAALAIAAPLLWGLLVEYVFEWRRRRRSQRKEVNQAAEALE